MSDLELIIDVQTNQSDSSLEKLALKYNKVYYDICSKYCKKHDLLRYDDLVDDFYYILYQAIIKYNPSKNTKFSTWLGYCARFHCLKTIRAIGLEQPNTNKDIDILNLRMGLTYTPISSCSINYIFDILSQLKDNRIYKIFQLRFLTPNRRVSPWTDVAKELNLSKTSVITLYERGRKLLISKLASKTTVDIT